MTPRITTLLTMFAASTLIGEQCLADDTLTPAEAYHARCAACHEPIQGPSAGVWFLRATRGPDQALLSQRKDLTAEYIRLAVREGLTVMPPLTRAEVTDEELDAVITFLTAREDGQ